MADRVLTESHTLYTCYNLLQMVYDHSRQGSLQITNLEGENQLLGGVVRVETLAILKHAEAN